MKINYKRLIIDAIWADKYILSLVINPPINGPKINPIE